MLGFYLGGALMNGRDYEAARAVQTESADALAAIEPTSLIRLWSTAGAAMSLTMLGRPDAALELLNEVAALADWTDWSADWFFARAVGLAYEGEFEDAHATLCSIGARFDNVDVSPMTSTVVAGFGVVAHRRGDDERARTLFEPLIATRTPTSTAVLYETLAEMGAWPGAGVLGAALRVVGRGHGPARDGAACGVLRVAAAAAAGGAGPVAARGRTQVAARTDVRYADARR